MKLTWKNYSFYVAIYENLQKRNEKRKWVLKQLITREK